MKSSISDLPFLEIAVQAFTLCFPFPALEIINFLFIHFFLLFSKIRKYSFITEYSIFPSILEYAERQWSFPAPEQNLILIGIREIHKRFWQSLKGLSQWDFAKVSWDLESVSAWLIFSFSYLESASLLSTSVI